MDPLEFEWNEKKEQKNVKKHGIDFEAAILIWEGPTLEFIDDRVEYGEERWIAIGMADEMTLTVVFTWRGAGRRIISARKASRYERRAYCEALPRGS